MFPIGSIVKPWVLRAVAAVFVAWPACGVAQLESITQREAVAGLRAALERGSQQAVAKLGRADGFLGNAQVKIPLPDSLTRAERLMRRFGAGRYADDLIVAMNRAAEAAVPEARDMLIAAVKQMSVQDAKGILTGGETAGTEYFRRTTHGGLHKRFLPIVKRETARVRLAQKYNRYADKGVSLGVVKEEHADLDEYVTQKALDGLYFMVAEEEKKIRKDPVGTGKAILRKVFGALKL
jgi:hypothetical protein